MPYAEQSTFVTLLEAISEIAETYFDGDETQAAADLGRALDEFAVMAYGPDGNKVNDRRGWREDRRRIPDEKMRVFRSHLKKYYPELWQAAATPHASASTVRSPRVTDKTAAVGAIIRELWPNGRPNLTRPQMVDAVNTQLVNRGENRTSESTLDRAAKLVWG